MREDDDARHAHDGLGRLYWLVMMPFHLVIFGKMADRIARTAASRSRGARAVR